MKKLLPVSFIATILPFAAIAGHRAVPTPLNQGEAVILKTVNFNGVTSEIIPGRNDACPQLTSQPALLANDEDICKFTVIVDKDETNKTSPSFMALIKDDMVSYATYSGDKRTYNVPSGGYLLQAIFNDKDNAGAVIFLQVDVEDGKEIHISSAMADKEITTAMLLPSGDRAVLKKSADDSDYNIETLELDIHITYDGISKGSTQMVIQNGGEKYIDVAKIKTNVDDEHGEVFYAVRAISSDASPVIYFYMVSSSLDRVTESLTLTNNPDNYHKVDLDVIERTKAYDPENDYAEDYEVKFSVYNSSSTMAGGVSATLTKDAEVYACVSPTDFGMLHPLMQINTTEHYYLDEETWDEEYGCLVTPLFGFSENGIEYFATQVDNPYHNDKPVWETLPVNPSLSFAGTPDLKFGENFAVCVSAVEYEPWADVPFSYIVPACYYGNYGESRSIDVVKATTEIKYNGVFQDIPGGSVYDWAEQWAQSEHEPGKLTYIFTDNNFSIDGIAGSNVCEVSFTEGTEDAEPPTVQRIMFRTSDGNVTNRFEEVAGATVTIVGGDFIRNRESVNTGAYPMTFTYYTFADVECTAEYAPNGTSDFNPMTLEVDPDKFFMPGFGEYATGVLSQVCVESANGWYDLRVSLTDNAGNTQVQTISPAFKIEKLSGINTVECVSSTTVLVENNRIVSTDGSAVEVYDIVGARIPNDNLRAGIYIAKTADKCVKVQVK